MRTVVAVLQSKVSTFSVKLHRLVSGLRERYDSTVFHTCTCGYLDPPHLEIGINVSLASFSGHHLLYMPRFIALNKTPDAREALWNHCMPNTRKSQLLHGTHVTFLFGKDPDVDNTFFRWDGSIGHVPIEAVQKGIQDFEAGIQLATISPESKAGLVHVVAVGMLLGHLTIPYARHLQIRFFLKECYRRIVMHDCGHWIHKTLRDRTEELKWLEYQAEKRFRDLVERRKLAELNQESSDDEMDALFDPYTYHPQLPPPPE